MDCGELGFKEDEEEYFDSREDLSSATDACSESGDDGGFDEDRDDWYGVWVRELESVEERRTQFSRWMGLSSSPDLNPVEDREEDGVDIERLTSVSGAVLGSLDVENDYDNFSLSSASSCRSRGVDDGAALHFEDLREGVSPTAVSVAETPRKGSLDASFLRRILQRDNSSSTSACSRHHHDSPKRAEVGWLKRMSFACVAGEREVSPKTPSYHTVDKNTHRIKVHPCRKKIKEFSALYVGQDFDAHEGPILTMKFSPDGRYLASGGEDGVVRVWHVTGSNWANQDNFPEEDPSCIYFTANHKLQLNPVYTNTSKDKSSKSWVAKNSLDSACVIIPPDIFQISEQPLHEFRGHKGDVLDLSWSKDKCLLSASIDKTVRLWRVDCENCIKVFHHNDYVTCVQFNPVEDRYFISGSIDGKIRIWDTKECHVVDWTDLKEIVSAACYRSDGKEVVIGSMEGNCCFYDTSDNQFCKAEVVSLPGRKRSYLKRITGFEFSPTDPQKLMVTSADSHIRILDNREVVSKYRGLRNAGSQISASFTSDGKHIISASEDSNVYVWNDITQNTPTTNHVKNIWSSEHFQSSNVIVAIPWTGYKNYLPANPDAFSSQQELVTDLIGDLEGGLGRPTTPGGCTLSHRIFSEYLFRSSATWPEEKLSKFSLTSSSSLSKSKCKFLTTCCQNMVESPHAWGQVIVTAGADGRIRSYCNYGLPVKV